MILGKFVVKCSVLPLHLKHPFKFITCFVKDVGDSVTRFRNVQFIRTSLGTEDISVKEMRNRNGTGTYILSVVSGIVPSACNEFLNRFVLPFGGGCSVTCGMGEPACMLRLKFKSASLIIQSLDKGSGDVLPGILFYCYMPCIFFTALN